MENKYNISFSNEVINTNLMRLTNQLWKLIPMKENKEDWQRQLETVLLEIVGLNELFVDNPHFLQLILRLEGLKIQKGIEFSIYRKSVFDCINLLQGMKQYE